MVDVTRKIVPSTVTGVVCFALGSVGASAAVTPWSDGDWPRYSAKIESSTYSSVFPADLSGIRVAGRFEQKFNDVYTAFVAAQVPLGAEFEAAIFDDVESLYEQ
jgi:hypothetical protein